jgi:hypothetical protein
MFGVGPTLHNTGKSPQQQCLSLLDKYCKSPAGIYDPVKGYMQLPANLVTWSGDLTDASYTKVQLVASKPTDIAPPKQGITPIKLTATSGANGSSWRFYKGPATTADTNYTAAIYYKPGSGAPYVLFNSDSNGSEGVFFNATTGAYLSRIGTAYSGESLAVANGWYMLVVNFRATLADSNHNMFWCLTNRTNTAANGADPGFVGGEYAYFGGYGVFEGTLTAAQIHAMGGIPWTRETASVALTLGPRLEVNGEFDSDTGWTKGAGISIANGGATFNNGAGYPNLTQNYAYTSGKSYQYDITVSAWLAGAAAVFTTKTGYTPHPNKVTGVGTFSDVFVADGTYNLMGVQHGSPGGTNSYTFDSISVRELISTPCPLYTDAHAYIPGSYSLVTPANLLKWSRDFANGTWSSSSAALLRTATELVEIATSDYHRVGYSLAGIPTTQRTFAFEVKPAGRNYARGWSWGGADSGQQTFTLIGAGSSTGSLPTSIAKQADGWYMCTFSVPLNQAGNVVFGPSDGVVGGTDAYMGIAGLGLSCRGAGLFEGNYTADQLIAMGGIPWTRETPNVSLSLGNNLITNSEFKNKGSGWTIANGSVNFDSGKAVFGANSTQFYQYLSTLTVNKQYQFDWEQSTAGLIYMNVGGGWVVPAHTGTGPKSYVATADAALQVYVYLTTGGVAGDWIDNLTVRELISTPCPIYAPTSSLGLASNNFNATMGNTGYTPVEGEARLVYDALSKVGPELVPNVGKPFVNTAGWAGNQATIAVVGGKIRVTATVASGGYISGYVNLTGLTPGATLQVTGMHTAGTATTNYIATYLLSAGSGNGASTPVLASGAAGSYSQVVDADGSIWIAVAGTSTGIGSYYDIDFLSVKEIIGIHATSANVYTRRGLVNQTTNSDDVSGGISPTGLTFVTNSVHSPLTGTNTADAMRETVDASRHTLVNSAVLATGTYNTVAVIAKQGVGTRCLQTANGGGGWANFNLQTGVVGSRGGPYTHTSDILALGDGWHLCTFVAIPAAGAYNRWLSIVTGANSAWLESYTGDGTSSIIIARQALLDGYYTPKEIMDAGGLPLTTTVAASNPSAGRYVWSMLTLTGMKLDRLPFTYLDDFVVVACFRASKPGAWLTVFSLTGVNGIARMQLYASSGNYASLYMSGDTNLGGGGYIHSTVNCTDKLVIATVVKRGGTAYLRVNGVQAGSAVIPVSVATFTGSSIGELHSGSDNFWGYIASVIPIKATVPDSELLAIERAVGQPLGIYF